jgi:hypothetical protein
VQIEEKLFSIINFKGRKAEEVKKTLVTAALTNDSVENKTICCGRFWAAHE